MTPIRRAYAAQRLISYRRDTIRRRREFAFDVVWAILAMTTSFAFIVSGIFS